MQTSENKNLNNSIFPDTVFPSLNYGAELSECNQYRYKLWRIWDESKPKVLFIMLNPSTADAIINDATIRRCIKFTKDWGYGGFYVGNLYPYRSKEPADLLKCENPLGENNNNYLKEMALSAEIIICAWGNAPTVNKLNKIYPHYKPLENLEKPLCYLGLSNDGTPKHPLYLLKTLKPIKY